MARLASERPSPGRLGEASFIAAGGFEQPATPLWSMAAISSQHVAFFAFHPMGSPRCLTRDSEDLNHLLAAMLGIADQPLAARVYDQVEQLERHLADQHGTVVGDFRDLDDALPILHGQSHWPANAERRRSRGRARRPPSLFG
jgi:hypothetical protein